MSTLYLIPTPLWHNQWTTIAPVVQETLPKIQVFLAERKRTAQHFLTHFLTPSQLQEVIIIELHTRKHKKLINYIEIFEHFKQKKNIGLLSEAGLPCIADPGHAIVAAAHAQNIRVVPLPGSSSVVLALAASGFDGQQFIFHGYLPREIHELRRKLQRIERASYKNTPQIFIEAPHRTEKLLQFLIKTLHPNTFLCVAAALGSPESFILTKKIALWKKENIKNLKLHKQPAVFIIGNIKI